MSKKSDSERAERIKQELWGTFIYEMEELLESLEQQLLQLDGESVDDDVIAGLFRTMHTVKGTCGMMGLTRVESFTHKAEDLLDSVRDGKVAMNGSILDVLFCVSDVLKGSSDSIIEHRNDESFDAPLDVVNRLQVLLDDIQKVDTSHQTETGQQAEESAAGECSSLLGQLIQETLESLDQVEYLCLSLDVDAGDRKIIDDLFRNVHSLKGNVNLAGMRNATNLLHKTEDLIGVMRDGSQAYAKEIIDITLKVNDTLRKHFQGLSDTAADLESGDIENTLIEIVDLGSQISSTASTSAPANNTPAEIGLDMVQGSGDITLDESYVEAYQGFVVEQLNGALQLLKSDEPPFKNKAQEFYDLVQECIHASSVIGAQGILAQMQLWIDSIQADISCLPDIIAALELFTEKLIACDTLSAFREFISTGESLAGSTQSEKTPNRDLAGEAANSQEEKSEMTSDEFFDLLWAGLSSIRKSLDKMLESQNTVQAEILASATALRTLTGRVQGFNVVELIDQLIESIQQSVFDEASQDSCARILQTIYTLCWDLEDAVNEQGHAFVIASDIPPAAQGAKAKIQAKPAPETSIQAQDFAVDVHVDPLFVLDFVVEARPLVLQLEAFLVQIRETKSKDPATILGQDYRVAIDVIQKFRINALSVDVLSVVQLCDQIEPQLVSDTPPALLHQFVVEAYRLLVQVQDSIPDSIQQRHHADLNLSHVFKMWHAEQCLLVEPWILSVLSQVQSDVFRGDIDSAFIFLGEQIPEFSRKIESFLFAAQYYNLRQCEHASLLVRDFVLRLGFDTSLYSSAKIETIIEIVNLIVSSVNQILVDGDVQDLELIEACKKLEKELVQREDSVVLERARQFLLSGDLPKPLEAALDNETLSRVSDALNNSLNIYLLHVDVEHDDELADKTFDLMNSGEFETLMSATAYYEDRSYFECLITSHLNAQEFTTKLSTIDPSSQSLCLKSLVLKKAVSAELSPSIAGQKRTSASDGVSELNSAISELLTTNSAIDQIAAGMSDDNLYVQIDALVKANGGQWEQARFDVQNLLLGVENERKALQQAQQQLSGHLRQVQYGMRQLQEASVAELCQHILSVATTEFPDTMTLFLELDDERLLLEYQYVESVQVGFESLLCSLDGIRSALGCAHFKCKLTVKERMDELLFQFVLEPTFCEALLSQQELRDRYAEVISKIDDSEASSVRWSLILDQTLASVEARVPRHLDVIDAIIVRSGSDHYVVPTHLVKRIVNMADVSFVRRSVLKEGLMIKIDDELYGILDMDSTGEKKPGSEEQKIIMLLHHGAQSCGFIVDELLGMQQVVLAPLHNELKSNSRLMGCVVLGKDRIGFVLKSSAVFGVDNDADDRKQQSNVETAL